MDKIELDIPLILVEADEETFPTSSSGATKDGSTAPNTKTIEEYTDSDVTLERITELKLKGFIRPPGVSKEKWNSAPEFTPDQLRAAKLLAGGTAVAIVARSLLLESMTIASWLAIPKFKDEIKVQQELLFGKDTRKRIEALGPRAVDAIEDVMDSPGTHPKLVLQAASYLLDQAVGKSKQEIEHKGTLLIDVLKQIEKLPPQTRELSEMDVLVQSVLPADFTVGKRYEG